MKPVHPENPVYPESAAIGVEAPPELPPSASAEAATVVRQVGQAEKASSSHPADDRTQPSWLAIWLEELYSLSYLGSALLHVVVVLALAMLIFRTSGQGPDIWLEGTFQQPVIDTFDLDNSLSGQDGGDFSVPRDTNPMLTKMGTSTSIDVPTPALSSQASVVQRATQQNTFSLDEASNLLAAKGGGLSGRDPANRRRLALGGGGTEDSEAAVELGLQWLAEHQHEDGGWRFNLEDLPQCQGACRNSGFLESTTGSTGLALLCFLGAGYTQHEGPYQDVVAKGIYYLIGEMYITSLGGDLRGLTELDKLGEGSPMIRKNGDMYSHGIATLALCEAYAMTGDKNIHYHAQQAVDFTVFAQHTAGGWRYEPKEPGDTTVTGWQITALKSGLLGDLQIPREVWYRATEYLDSVQDDRGATYGYQQPQTNRPSTTAVGLLCRMMLGWPKDHDPLLRGAARLAKEDPLDNHMYFNYYATQVLRHVGGSGWAKWNPRMRDHLVRTQAKAGHERGSWWVREPWSDRGGRLYTTCLSILTLEVYYRYLPMYGEDMVEIGP